MVLESAILVAFVVNSDTILSIVSMSSSKSLMDCDSSLSHFFKLLVY